jgi:hypothetical protein
VLTDGGGVGRRRQGRDVRRRDVGMRVVGSRGIDRVARGRTGSVGRRARGDGRLGARDSVGRLDRWI